MEMEKCNFIIIYMNLHKYTHGQYYETDISFYFIYIYTEIIFTVSLWMSKYSILTKNKIQWSKENYLLWVSIDQKYVTLNFQTFLKSNWHHKTEIPMKKLSLCSPDTFMLRPKLKLYIFRKLENFQGFILILQLNNIFNALILSTF